MLGIHSLLKRQPLKHNVVDRDKILIPPNWDSWGKIRALDKTFNLERVHNGWVIDLQEPPTTSKGAHVENNHTTDPSHQTTTIPSPPADDDQQLASATALYEELIPDAPRDFLTADADDDPAQAATNNKLEVETTDPQEFLAAQQEVLERLRQEDEKQTAERKVTRLVDPTLPKFARNYVDGATVEEVGINLSDEGLVKEHIGPVQFNVGGIQVDADDMLKRIAVCSFGPMMRYHSSMGERERRGKRC